MNTLDLTIKGMSCGHCVGQVRTALAALEGVAVQTVGIGSAAVEYDPAVQTPQTVAAAVTEAGYAATPTASAA